jgi:hypothetical protein
MQIRAYPCPGYIFLSQKGFFILFSRARRTVLVTVCPACTSPPAIRASARETPPPGHLHHIFHCWPSISDPRIPDICLSPDTDSDLGFPEYESNLNPDCNTNPCHISFWNPHWLQWDPDPGS